MAVIQMPSRGGVNESGMITKWYKKTGDWVESGDELFSFDTEEGTFTVKSQKAGRLVAIFVPEGEIVHCPADVGMLATPTPDSVLKMGRQQFIDGSKPVDAPQLPAPVEEELPEPAAEDDAEQQPEEEAAEEAAAEAEETEAEEPVEEENEEENEEEDEEDEQEPDVVEDTAIALLAAEEEELSEDEEEEPEQDELVAYDELAQEEISAQDAEEIYEVERSAGEEVIEEAPAEAEEEKAQAQDSASRWERLRACFTDEDSEDEELTEEEYEAVQQAAEETWQQRRRRVWESWAELEDPVEEEAEETAPDAEAEEEESGFARPRARGHEPFPRFFAEEEAYYGAEEEPQPRPACITAVADMTECLPLALRTGVRLRTWVWFAMMRSPLGNQIDQAQADTLGQLDAEACSQIVDLSEMGIKSVQAAGDGSLRLVIVAVQDGKVELMLSFDENKMAIQEAAEALHVVCENLNNLLRLIV